ncbi:Adenosylcobinamide-phosphate synthase [hydrothermal vent metagenome]|uniref:Adenosylcobinamide-phosphate synthase n=1 Tax=hydrothermal vent metagenome TaxID=652676 RepID=A0A3B0ZI35_9ZZZZ
MLDVCFGEPRRYHPLVGFGNLVQWLERQLYADSRLRGMIAVLLLLLPFTLLAYWFARGFIIEIMLLYLAIGWRSLEQHAQNVRQALADNDLPNARQQVSLMVSRDTATLDVEGVSKATLESVLENGNDAIFGAIFWFVIAGAPGVVLYRLANTLDAMWGYRTERYHHFGWAAARLDDLLNFIPARLTALSYALAGHSSMALRCWRHQAKQWKSPNAGPVMAAGAGSLGLQLGGVAQYHGENQQRPVLGAGRAAQAEDIERALRLIRYSLLIWLCVLLLAEWFV